VATKAAMTSVECGTREVSEQTQEIRLRGVCPCARPSRLVCFAQAQVRRLRSTSAGCESRLHVYGARVWRHGAGVCAQDYRHTWAHASAMRHRSCRVTARRCIRGRRIMACQTTKSRRISSEHRCRLQICLCCLLQRPGRALPASSVSTARSCDRPCPERPIDPAIDCVDDSSMSATAALSMSITCLCRSSYLWFM
jgi:hypothetical protein